jgi:hypothetical protein
MIHGNVREKANVNYSYMQRAQSKILRTITNAPRYVTNHTLHTDLNTSYVSEVIN